MSIAIYIPIILNLTINTTSQSGIHPSIDINYSFHQDNEIELQFLLCILSQERIESLLEKIVDASRERGESVSDLLLFPPAGYTGPAPPSFRRKPASDIRVCARVYAGKVHESEQGRAEEQARAKESEEYRDRERQSGRWREGGSEKGG